MLFYKGRIYIKDFLAELKDHDIEIPQAEVKKIMEFSDREGQVGGEVVGWDTLHRQQRTN